MLRNLVKMYCYEWSQYNLFDVDDKGEYPFEAYLAQYFERPRRYCYFARVDGVLAGFALIDDDFAYDAETSDYSMGEFFVMHKYRRYGVGRRMAEYLFSRYPGVWEVGFHPHNGPSVCFWPKVIADYTGGKYVLHEGCKGLAYHDGSLGNVIVFDSGRGEPSKAR